VAKLEEAVDWEMMPVAVTGSAEGDWVAVVTAAAAPAMVEEGLAVEAGSVAAGWAAGEMVEGLAEEDWAAAVMAVAMVVAGWEEADLVVED
jgi:hypothetical protein